MPRPSASSCTSPQRSAAASDLRKPPWNSMATIARSMAPRAAAAASDSIPRPVCLGRLAVAMIAATSPAVSGSAWPRPRPAAWRVRPCRTRRTPSWPVGSSAPVSTWPARIAARIVRTVACPFNADHSSPTRAMPIGTARECSRSGYHGVPCRRAPGRLRSIRPAGWWRAVPRR